MNKCEADVTSENFITYVGFTGPAGLVGWGDWGEVVSARMRRLREHYPETWSALTSRFGRFASDELF